ncbi:MAG: glycosyltransferase family 39 protein, partial [Chloroflexia bacterium]
MLVQTPLHYLLVWLTIQPFDPAASAVLVRLPSAVAGALTPLVVYGLGKETFGRAQGLLAALMVAVSAVHIGHSQDVRPYTLLVLLSALSLYSLLKAEKTGQAGWWAVFTFVTILDLHFSYFALTLFLPALAIYLLWIIYKSWVKRSSESAALRNALLSFGAIALASTPLLLDLLQLHRTTPNWEVFFDIVGRQVALLPARLAPLGIAGSMEEAIQWGFGVLAIVGALTAVQQKKSKAVLLCVLMILIPALLLAVFRTSNIVFQRYALFAMPFYFLLLANGVVFLWRIRPTIQITTEPPRRQERQLPAKILWGLRITNYVGGAVGTLLLLLFAYSSFLYFSPEQHRRLSFLPDYRGVASYLTQQAGP